MQFVLFWCIWDYLVALQNSLPNGQNRCKSSCHEVASEFFAMKAPDPTHWTLNSHFGVFHTIWVHLGLFGCHRTLSAKRVKTGAKVRATKSRWNFSNEHPQSTPLDPKLMFWCVSYYLGVFGTVFCPTTLSAKWVNWCKSLSHEVALNFSQ